METSLPRRFCNCVSGIILVSATSLVFQTSLADEETPWQMGSRPSELIMTQITVSNIKKSRDFYMKLLGMKQAYVPGEAKGTLEEESTDKRKEVYLNYSGSFANAYLELVQEKGAIPSPEYTKQITIGLKTNELQATLSRVKASQYPVQLEPITYRGLLLAIVSDPDGYNVALIQARSVRARTSNAQSGCTNSH
jgi:hypothetical protein